MEGTTMESAKVLLSGLGLVESPRWHDGRLWFADWTAGEILVLNDDGSTRVACKAAAPPLSFDFASDGAMLVVASGASHLLRQDSKGRLEPFAPFGIAGAWNEIVVDALGRIYVNGPRLLLIRPDGSVEPQAEGFEFPNGMAVSEDGRTLVCAESWGRQLTAFDIAEDGRLSNRRIWAQLQGPPDGICLDSQGALWYADVPNACCRRVREGGELLDEIKLDRGGFACMLGGADRRTLFITAAQWFGMDRMGEMGGTGQVLAVDVTVPGAGWPFG
jgi:sugar lactone lactonase YvrE